MNDPYSDTAVLATERASDRAHEILCDAEQLQEYLVEDLPAVAKTLVSFFWDVSNSPQAMKLLHSVLHASIVSEIYEEIEIAEHEEQCRC